MTPRNRLARLTRQAAQTEESRYPRTSTPQAGCLYAPSARIASRSGKTTGSR